MMRRIAEPATAVALVLGAIWLAWPAITQDSHSQSSRDDMVEVDEPGRRLIRMYEAPEAFQQGYVTILREFISSDDALRFPDPEAVPAILPGVTEEVESDLEPEGSETVNDVNPVQYDSERGVIVALADQAEHREIQSFLDRLKTIETRHEPIVYRLAMVERSIHPKLKEFPYEFDIRGKAWDDGRYGNRFPKWMNDLKERFPDLLFSDIDTDREENETRFEVEGFARSEEHVNAIYKAVERADDTKAHTKTRYHDFMKESRENLEFVLSDIFPHSKLEAIIKSLQTTNVYQVEAEAILASQSSIPGRFRTVLGDDFGVSVACEESVREDGSYSIEVLVYKKGHDGDSVFEDNNIHLSTTLITRLGQINMMGIRHHDDRYVLLFSMEKPA